jgi:hypothetical protein
LGYWRLHFAFRIMPRAKGGSARIDGVEEGNARLSSASAQPSDSHVLVPKNFHPACTNRLRAGQIAASMLVDFDTVDIR